MTPLEQRRAALAAANEVRIARANVRRGLATSTLTLADALQDASVANLTILALLAMQRGVGLTRARDTLRTLGIPAARRVRELTPRQHLLLTTAPPPPTSRVGRAVVNGESTTASGGGRA